MQPNTTIGHYTILRPLGAGGMGEVYLAEDTRLKRQVAVKVLPERLRSNEGRLKRFRREAEAAASLNHPNIAHIYALEEFPDPDGEQQLLITMEHVEGKTLKDAIPEGGMELEAFFDIFIPLADALSHAHSQGRIHRDLKPANIMILADGTPKILDFGLARIIDPDAVEAYSDTDLGEDDATQTMKDGVPSLTRGGQLIGTPQYMSPEQAERKDTDARTDIFSFGLVMYEALTGQRAFDGDSLESIIGRILVEEPEAVTELRPITPYTLWTVIRRCIAKKPDRRMQGATELVAELEAIQQDIQAGTVLVDASTIPSHSIELEPPPSPALHLWRQPLAISGMVLTLIIGLTAAWLLKPPPDPVLRKYQLTEGRTPAISPDGTMVAYTKTRGGTMWVRDLQQLEAREIPSAVGAFNPFWSPGSDYIGYRTQSEMRKVAAQGGPSTTLCQLPFFASVATWKRDGTILVTQPDGIYMVSSQGGESAAYLWADSTKGEQGFSSIHVLPDGQILLLSRLNLDNSTDIVVQDGDIRRSLLHSNPGEFVSSPVYAQSGHILYTRRSSIGGRNLWAIPFDLSSLTRTGDPVLVAEDVTRPTVSNDGTLVYYSAAANPVQELVWVDRNGQVTGTFAQTYRGIRSLALAPDGRRVAVESNEPDNREIWIHDADRNTRTRLTFDPLINSQPTWSPDGASVAFMRGAGPNPLGGQYDIMMQAADGGSPMEPLAADSLPAFGPNWSHDGQSLAYHVGDVNTGRDIWMVPLTGNRTPRPVVQGPKNELLPSISPDSRYVAYVSDESDRWEVYVTRFPEGGGRWQVSTDGGVQPRWTDKELFYLQGETLMAVPIDTRTGFNPGTPKALFSGQQIQARLSAFTPAPYFFVYDVTADGRLFVMFRTVSAVTGPLITVVQNWSAEFKDRN